MPVSVVASAALDREYLGIRCRLIELAAALDRIERGKEPAAADPRIAQIGRSLEILAGGGPNRAEQVQLVFSKEGSGVRGQGSGVRGQGSGAKGQDSEGGG